MTESIFRAKKFITHFVIGLAAVLFCSMGQAQCTIELGTPFPVCDNGQSFVYIPCHSAGSNPWADGFTLKVNNIPVDDYLEPNYVFVAVDQYNGANIDIEVFETANPDCSASISNLETDVDCSNFTTTCDPIDTDDEFFYPEVSCNEFGYSIAPVNPYPSSNADVDIYVNGVFIQTSDTQTGTTVDFSSEGIGPIALVGVYIAGTDCGILEVVEMPEFSLCSDGASECSIDNLFAEVYCQDGNVFVDFEFDAIGFENNFFDYSLGGQTYFAEVGETFYTIENVDLAPGFYELTVSENDNPACTAGFDIEIVCCGQPQLEGIFADANCADVLTELSVTGDTGNPNYIYNWQGPDGPGPQGVDQPIWTFTTPVTPGEYTLVVNNADGNCVQEFSETVFAGGDGASFQGADVCVGAEGFVLIYPDEDSSFDGVFGGPLCTMVGVNCGIDPAGVPYVQIDQIVVAANPGVVGTSVGLVYSVGNSTTPCFSFSSQVINFLDQSLCAEDCEVVISALPVCDGDVYYVDITWTGVNFPTPDPSWEFTLQGNGTNYGIFPIGQTEVQLGPFTSDQTINEFGITISNNGVVQCQGDTGFEAPNCSGDCAVADLFAEAYCIEGVPAIAFEFNANGFENAFFDYTLGNQTGFAELGEDFYTIENLVAGSYVLTVSENDNPSCTASITVIVPECPVADCEVYDVIAESLGCEDGEYYVLIDFEIVGIPAGSTQFGINGNGTQYGTWNYADAPVTLGPFTSDQTINEFGITISNNGVVQCQGDTGFGAPNCDGDCAVTDLFAEAYCIEGVPAIDFEFNANGFENAFFDFSLGDQTGFAELGDDFYTIENLAPGTYVLTVSENDNPSCTASITVIVPECPVADCEVYDVSAESLGCEDGEYYVLIDFEIVGIPTGSTQFGINGNGTQYGTWNYADAPVVLGPFTEDQTINEFAVFDASVGNDCQNYAEFQAPNCSEAYEFAELVDCDSDNVTISVDPSNWNSTDTDNFYVQIYEAGILPGEPEGGPFLFADGIVEITVPFSGLDCKIFWVQIVDGENPVISMSTSLTVCPCTEGDVWPGDTNNDGVANNFDFLNIGLAYGSQGVQRPNASLSWFGQFCPNWVQNFFSGLNFKFTDCDGNGVINGADGLAIDQNYGSTHGKTEGEEGTEDEAPLYVDFPDQALSPGEEVSFPIVFGTSDDPVETVYGFAFSIEYEEALIVEPEIVFSESWVGTESIDAQSFVKHFPNEKRFEIAFTRIDQLNASGFGVIGHIQGILIENIEGYQVGQAVPINVTISNVGILNATEAEVPFSLTPESGSVVSGIEDSANSITVYPNPASNFVMLQLPELSDNAEISLLSSDGRVVRTLSVEKNTQRIDLDNLINGIYFIEIVDLETRVLRKIDIIR